MHVLNNKWINSSAICSRPY